MPLRVSTLVLIFLTYIMLCRVRGIYLGGNDFGIMLTPCVLLGTSTRVWVNLSGRVNENLAPKAGSGPMLSYINSILARLVSPFTARFQGRLLPCESLNNSNNRIQTFISLTVDQLYTI